MASRHKPAPRLNKPVGKAVKINRVNFDAGTQARIAEYMNAGQDSQKKTGRDTAFDPFYSMAYRMSKDGKIFDRIGFFVPAQEMVHPIELYCASLTPKGYFITHVAPRNAFRHGWEYVKQKKSTIPLDQKLKEKLVSLVRKNGVKFAVISAVQVSETFGRALLYRRNIAPRGKKEKWKLFVSRLPEEWVKYDEDNVIKEYYIQIGWGQYGYKMLTVKPEDAILFIGEIDPNGNGHQGIPALLPVYRDITRAENIKDSYANLITQRGLGLVDIKIEGVASQEELDPWVEEYGDPSSYNAIIHNERMEVQTADGIKASFSLDETVGRYTKEMSSGSGFPTMRMEGVQTGTVTGSETDQDNQAENYSSLQERYEPCIIETLNMLDPSLENEDFELDFPMDIKLDRMKQTQIFATEAGAIMTVPDLLTVNEARDRLKYPPVKENGDMTVTELINETMPEETPPDENPRESPGTPPVAPSESEKQARNATNPNEGRNWEEIYDKERFFIDSEINFDFEDKSDKNIDAWIDSCVKKHADGSIPATTKRDEYISTGLKKFSIPPADKDKIATALVKFGITHNESLSYTEVNNILTSVFGSGKNYNWIAEARKRK